MILSFTQTGHRHGLNNLSSRFQINKTSGHTDWHANGEYSDKRARITEGEYVVQAKSHVSYWIQRAEKTKNTFSMFNKKPLCLI